MREGWVQTTLGDLCTLTRGVTPTMKAIPGKYPLVVTAADFLSSDEYQFEGEAVCVPLVSSTGHGHASLKRVHYASGKFAVANIITALQRREHAPVQMKFLWLLLDHGRDEIIVPLMKGTANVSLSQGALAGAEVRLPPLDEQRRIVDLINALDDTIAAAERQRSETERALTHLSQLLLPELGDPEGAPLESLLRRSIGGVWGEPSGEAEVEVVAFRSTEFSDWGHVVQKDPARRSVTAREFSSRQLAAGDILIEKSGGTPSRPVGRVIQFQAEDLRTASIGTNFMQIITPDTERVLARFLFWLLWSNHRGGGTVLFQQASTNIRNLQTKAYLKQRVVLPVMERQVDVANTLDAGLAARNGVVRQLGKLRELRSNLLTALLSGEHEIPESYDELMEGVAA